MPGAETFRTSAADAYDRHVGRYGASLAAALIAFARERLAGFKCPAAVEFTELPKTSTGKVQKFVLRDKEWSGRDRRIN